MGVLHLFELLALCEYFLGMVSNVSIASVYFVYENATLALVSFFQLSELCNNVGALS